MEFIPKYIITYSHKEATSETDGDGRHITDINKLMEGTKVTVLSGVIEKSAVNIIMRRSGGKEISHFESPRCVCIDGDASKMYILDDIEELWREWEYGAEGAGRAELFLTINEMPLEYNYQLLSNMADNLPSEVINALARRMPLLALRRAPDRLTPEGFDHCVRQRPEGALECVPEKLSPEVLDSCARQYPGTALRYVSHLLTPETIEYCALREPYAALMYAPDKLTAETIDICARQSPLSAIQSVMKHVPEKLLPETRKYFEDKYQEERAHVKGGCYV